MSLNSGSSWSHSIILFDRYFPGTSVDIAARKVVFFITFDSNSFS